MIQSWGTLPISIHFLWMTKGKATPTVNNELWIVNDELSNYVILSFQIS